MSSTSYELISNIPPQHRPKNFTNDFEVPIFKQIDGFTNDKHIEITEVTYPATSKNILQDECSVQLKIHFYDVVKHSDEVKHWFDNEIEIAKKKYKDILGEFHMQRESEVSVEIDKYSLPSGSYDIATILKIINRCMNPYSITFEQEENKRIKIRFGSVAGYYVNLKKPLIGDPKKEITTSHPGYAILTPEVIYYSEHGTPTLPIPWLSIDGGSLNEYRKSNTPSQMKYEITLSKKLAFILGFENPKIEKTVNATTNERHSKDENYVIGEYLPAQNAGQDRIYLYCNQIIGTNTGGSDNNLLVSVPRYEKEYGGGGVSTYTPPKTVHRLKKMKMDKFDIKVKDDEGKLVNFDSGTVNVKVIVT